MENCWKKKKRNFLKIILKTVFKLCKTQAIHLKQIFKEFIRKLLWKSCDGKKKMQKKRLIIRLHINLLILYKNKNKTRILLV